jgi:hypothetical protein
MRWIRTEGTIGPFNALIAKELLIDLDTVRAVALDGREPGSSSQMGVIVYGATEPEIHIKAPHADKFLALLNVAAMPEA